VNYYNKVSCLGIVICCLSIVNIYLSIAKPYIISLISFKELRTTISIANYCLHTALLDSHIPKTYIDIAIIIAIFISLASSNV
jgi:hypothetical protein